MESLKKIGIALLVIIFPLGILYCMLHTLGGKFISFMGGIFLLGTGVILGIYIVEPQMFYDFFSKVIGYLPFINK